MNPLASGRSQAPAFTVHDGWHEWTLPWHSSWVHLIVSKGSKAALNVPKGRPDR